MRYYIRQHKDSDIQGPFTVADLAAGVDSGRFSSDTLASSDLGDSVASLRVGRSCDWFLLADIPELKRRFPPQKIAAPQPRRVTVFTIIVNVVAGVWSVCFAMTEHRWFAWLLPFALILGAVDAILRYVRQRKHKSQAA